MHRTLITLVLLLAGAHSATAQLGVAGYYNSNSVALERQTPIESFKVLSNGPEIAVNYWFRLPKQRVEFLPTVFYNQADFSGEVGENRQLGVQAKINIYAFDFNGDCDCPTFGKQGPKIEKGFFFQIAPGYTFNRITYEENIFTGGTQFTDSETTTFFTLAGALGIDIGISNAITLTPTAGYRTSFGDFWDIERTDVNGTPTGKADTRISTYQIGLHLGFRFDADRY